MIDFDPLSYGPVFAPLLAVDRRRPLDAGTPDSVEYTALERLSVKAAFADVGQSVKVQAMAECCLAGVWLLHDFLEESHALSQGINTASGSFWHGIVHRREGDYSNAKYWFRHVGEHPVFAPLAQRAADLAAEHSSSEVVEKLTARETWEPFAFVELCQAAHRNGANRELCLNLQQAEWQSLFDFCYRAALRG